MKYIKFRAWDVEAEAMVDLIDTEEHFVFSKRLLHPDQYIPMMRVAKCEYGDVYEGDIVSFDVKGNTLFNPAITDEKGVVSFNPTGGTSYGKWASQECKNVKVIGNIYKNKDIYEELRIKDDF